MPSINIWLNEHLCCWGQCKKLGESAEQLCCLLPTDHGTQTPPQPGDRSGTDQSPSRGWVKGCWSIPSLEGRTFACPKCPLCLLSCGDPGSMAGHLPQPMHKPVFRLPAITGGVPSSRHLSVVFMGLWCLCLGIRASKKITCSSSNDTQSLLY